MPRIHVDNLIVDYVEAGEGLPLVFIPGITEYKESFCYQLRGLQDRYRVISYDLRRGLKKPTDYTLELLVDDLSKVLKGLGLRSAVICGCSFGGLIAMQYALRYPERTKALILVSSFPTAPDVQSRRLLNAMSSAGHPYHTSLGAKFKVQIARLLGRKSSGAVAMEHQFTALKEIAHQAGTVPQSTINQRMRLVKQADFRSALQEIVSPTLVIAGAKDRAFMLSGAQFLYESIPDATLEVIEGGGHFCYITRHDQFNSVVDDYLTAHMAAIS